MKDAILELKRLTDILVERRDSFSEATIERLLMDIMNATSTIRRRHKGIPSKSKSSTSDVIDELLENKLSMSDIARKFNISRQRISQIKKRYELPYERTKQRLPFDKIKEFYDKGLNDIQISREINCSSVSVSMWRKREGLKAHYNNKSRKKEDPVWLERAKGMLKAGMRMYSISKELGVGPSKVAYYLRRS